MTRDDHGEAVKGIAFKPRKKASQRAAAQALRGKGDMANLAEYVRSIAVKAEPVDYVLYGLADALDPGRGKDVTHKLELSQTRRGPKGGKSDERFQKALKTMDLYERLRETGLTDTAARDEIEVQKGKKSTTARDHVNDVKRADAFGDKVAAYRAEAKKPKIG
jgi:hypothetical protein